MKQSCSRTLAGNNNQVLPTASLAWMEARGRKEVWVKRDYPTVRDLEEGSVLFTPVHKKSKSTDCLTCTRSRPTLYAYLSIPSSRGLIDLFQSSKVAILASARGEAHEYNCVVYGNRSAQNGVLRPPVEEKKRSRRRSLRNHAVG